METKWVLKLIDQITAPLRSAQDAADDVGQAVGNVAEQAEDVQSAVNSVVRPMRAAASSAEGLSDAFDDNVDAATRLQRNIQTIQNNLDNYHGKLEVETDPEKIRVYTAMIEELEEKLHELENVPDTQEVKNKWGEIATAVNQTWEVAEKLLDMLDFAGEISNLQSQIELLTGATGQELEDLTQKTWHLSQVFGTEAEEIARAANAMTKQIGGSFEENLTLIQAGFEKGANLNGDFMDQLKEYLPQIKAMGLTSAQAIALMAKAGKDGVFSDKAIDSIKEANLSLREMGQPQIDALHAIGLKVKDVAGKTTFEAVQMITKAMQNAPIQAKQMALTDIFKGAGEDAGLQFIEGLGSVDMDINNLPSVKQATEGIQGFLADAQSWFATTFSGIASHVSVVGSIGAAITGFIPVYTALRTSVIGVAVASKIAAAGQWLWNAAFAASPIGWIVVGLAAVSTGVVLAWKYFEGFRETVMGLWEVFKTVFNNIAGLFKVVFGPIGEAITAIKDGRYTDAAKAALKLNPISMGISATEYIAKGGLTKGVGDAWENGKKKGRDSFAADQKPEKKETPTTSYTNDLKTDKPAKVTLDGKLFDPKSGKMTGGDGLNINGSGGGGKSITMHLNINNYFDKISNSLDIQKVADQVAGLINDRLRDAVVTTG